MVCGTAYLLRLTEQNGKKLNWLEQNLPEGLLVTAKRIDRWRINLGKGKRMLVRGGKLDSTYGITMPEDLDAVQ